MAFLARFEHHYTANPLETAISGVVLNIELSKGHFLTVQNDPPGIFTSKLENFTLKTRLKRGGPVLDFFVIRSTPQP